MYIPVPLHTINLQQHQTNTKQYVKMSTHHGPLQRVPLHLCQHISWATSSKTTANFSQINIKFHINRCASIFLIILWPRNVTELLPILKINSADITQLWARRNGAKHKVSPPLDRAGGLTQRFHWQLLPALHLLLLPSDLSYSLGAVCRVVIGTIASAAACHVTTRRIPWVRMAFQTYSC